MNSPCHPVRAANRLTGASNPAGTSIDLHALDPEPLGFIMRIRSWALRWVTTPFPARPNTPCPTPEIQGLDEDVVGPSPQHLPDPLLRGVPHEDPGALGEATRARLQRHGRLDDPRWRGPWLRRRVAGCDLVRRGYGETRLPGGCQLAPLVEAQACASCPVGPATGSRGRRRATASRTTTDPSSRGISTSASLETARLANCATVARRSCSGGVTETTVTRRSWAIGSLGAGPPGRT